MDIRQIAQIESPLYSQLSVDLKRQTVIHRRVVGIILLSQFVRQDWDSPITTHLKLQLKWATIQERMD